MQCDVLVFGLILSHISHWGGVEEFEDKDYKIRRRQCLWDLNVRQKLLCINVMYQTFNRTFRSTIKYKLTLSSTGSGIHKMSWANTTHVTRQTNS